MLRSILPTLRQPVRQQLARRTYASQPSYHQPSGYIFGEKPPPAGQKRVKEDWENLYYYGFFGGMVLAGFVLVYKPDTSIQAWATTEAQRRLEESGEWEKIKYKPSGSEGSVGV
ncbi:ESSS subunit of NADH:ubiquinone oxidoreductase-domain-containing protein [Filobasidium floriforme]|uniref:ESSS subunit of NADH:ubiquinone oxidoreductase-domain-containing protein n=1 Tax=Filobasidium floriforme TaxID=5210 RepID=UPI001E8EE7D6|nr:ESSS subunit of NADH:ubiquinone oxidoreductase-domain-containing protein [Filobasidium floriforme]KAH8081889.1 ESSS subunit of NADH:ubiquinone oxidoreductase-domain-containing protein [Filobasidium floriforme]